MTSEEKKKLLESKLSDEELKAIGGGVTINWPAECVSTVKDGENCPFNDACYYLNNQYTRSHKKYGCSATATVGGTCASNDNCRTFEIVYNWVS